MSTLKDKLVEWGMRLHSTKRKVQTTNDEWSTRGSVIICAGLHVDILPKGGSLTCLGTQIAAGAGSSLEVASRISKDWKMF